MENNDAAARRRNQGQMLRHLARIQREVHGAVESCKGIADITQDGVTLLPEMFRACFPTFRREPLDDNPHATARLVGYWGGVAFYTYIDEEAPHEPEAST